MGRSTRQWGQDRVRQCCANFVIGLRGHKMGKKNKHKHHQHKKHSTSKSTTPEPQIRGAWHSRWHCCEAPWSVIMGVCDAEIEMTDGPDDKSGRSDTHAPSSSEHGRKHSTNGSKARELDLGTLHFETIARRCPYLLSSDPFVELLARMAAADDGTQANFRKGQTIQPDFRMPHTHRQLNEIASGMYVGPPSIHYPNGVPKISMSELEQLINQIEPGPIVDPTFEVLISEPPQGCLTRAQLDAARDAGKPVFIAERLSMVEATVVESDDVRPASPGGPTHQDYFIAASHVAVTLQRAFRSRQAFKVLTEAQAESAEHEDVVPLSLRGKCGILLFILLCSMLGAIGVSACVQSCVYACVVRACMRARHASDFVRKMYWSRHQPRTEFTCSVSIAMVAQRLNRTT